ncbi:MAG: ROK family transcriptional regulator [Mycetocola sp.]
MDQVSEPVIGESSIELAREVLIHGPISRSELGRRLGLSPASLTRLSKPFLDRGLFIEAPEEHTRTVGRPTRPLDVRVDARRFVGVKITGTDVLGVRTDLRATEQASASRHLDEPSVDHVVSQIADVVTELGGAAAFSAIGVSIGGNVAGGRVVTRAPFLGWRGVDLATELERVIGIPAVIENDVVALTGAEHWFGAGRGIPNFAVVTIGAGVGYGLVIHDRVVVTADTGLGLGGHFPLDPSGPLCLEGHRGCATAMLSIPSICAQVGIALDRSVSYEDVLALAAEGNIPALTVLRSAGRALGRLLAAVANLAMLDTVVLSGEGLGLWPLARAEVDAAIAADRDPEASPLTVVHDLSDFSAWARGAAAVAIQATLARLHV